MHHKTCDKQYIHRCLIKNVIFLSWLVCDSVIFVLIYFLVLVLVFQLFFRFSFVLVFIIFYRATACNATHGIAVGILSVRPSVRQMRVL